MYCSVSNFHEPFNANIQYLMLAFFSEFRFSSDPLHLFYGNMEWFSLKKTIDTHSVNISLMFKECLF